jgi:PAS domain-containing protein
MAKHPHAALYDDPRLAEAMIATIQQPLLVLDENLTVLRANPAFLRAFQVDDDQVRGQAVYNLGNGQWQIPELRDLLGNVAGKAGGGRTLASAKDAQSTVKDAGGVAR